MTDQPLDLDAILARAAAATPGPWTANDRIGIVTDAAADPLAVFGGGKQDRADAEFTAHAREDIEALAAEIRRLRAELATARVAVLREVADTCDEAGGKYAARALNDHAAGAFTLMETFQRKANEAEYVATPCDLMVPCEDGGEPCHTHERLMAHGEGDHELCEPNCARPSAEEAHVVADDSKAGKAFTPGREDMEDCYDGILVASLGEDGDAIALTSDKHQALEALDQYFREVCGRPNLLDDATADLRDAYYWLDCGHAVFVRRADGGWDVTEAPANTPGAVPVVWFRHPAAGPIPEPYARRGGPRIW
jgi:hypothetical protein